ncbi:MAG: hypothetical protein K0S79_368 [Nitrospira sp.]|jgi:hypothetical protein|nr:hypothetical protein [Nitrospira sp.]
MIAASFAASRSHAHEATGGNRDAHHCATISRFQVHGCAARQAPLLSLTGQFVEKVVVA